MLAGQQFVISFRVYTFFIGIGPLSSCFVCHFASVQITIARELIKLEEFNEETQVTLTFVSSLKMKLYLK